MEFDYSLGKKDTAFTVSPSQTDKVHKYITNQIEHHRQRTFEDEYQELLRLSGVNFML